jgi:hypothetical protein
LDTVWNRRFSGPSVDGRGQDSLRFRYEINPSYQNRRRNEKTKKYPSPDPDPDGCLVQQGPGKGADIVRGEISALAKVTFSCDSSRHNLPREKNQKLVLRRLFSS